MAIAYAVMGALALVSVMFAFIYRASARFWYDQYRDVHGMWRSLDEGYHKLLAEKWSAADARDAAQDECDRLRREVEELRARLAIGESR